MIRLIPNGNIFTSGAEAITVTTNTHGIHGAGIALKARDLYPATAEQYTRQCRLGLIAPGSVWAAHTNVTGQDQWLLYCATKDSPRRDSQIEWVDGCLAGIVQWCRENRPRSLGVCALGAGCGRLPWSTVEPRIMAALGQLPDTMAVMVFAPHERSTNVRGRRLR